MAQQLRRLLRSALEAIAKIGGAVKTGIGGHGLVIITMRLKWTDSFVRAHEIGPGLEITTVMRKMQLAAPYP
ncbi:MULTISPECIES: hypothetical protein [unclassified Janthinobacterium]|uniref:hypothetical protein n=1 Tax=unclassified Janthinobacterium TaxID=2610881 RepID=UPI00160A12EB|nr:MULTISPECIES: hypothetical protein [unclassified Janthinobacterium]MBB5368388.1 hypothetical protein [Janthinobacterium sp. K2C7]MBB5382076.1 hypothetical protein [Janthinobacterium sp. K2Li3]MBB5386770.1 hypothetical protein [Janthinobacterium sp. K2E3]